MKKPAIGTPPALNVGEVSQLSQHWAIHAHERAQVAVEAIDASDYERASAACAEAEAFAQVSLAWAKITEVGILNAAHAQAQAEQQMAAAAFHMRQQGPGGHGLPIVGQG